MKAKLGEQVCFYIRPMNETNRSNRLTVKHRRDVHETIRWTLKMVYLGWSYRSLRNTEPWDPKRCG